MKLVRTAAALTTALVLALPAASAQAAPITGSTPAGTSPDGPTICQILPFLPSCKQPWI